MAPMIIPAPGLRGSPRAGPWINRRLSDRVFSKVVYVITFVLGWHILGDGILKLMPGA